MQPEGTAFTGTAEHFSKWGEGRGLTSDLKWGGSRDSSPSKSLFLGKFFFGGGGGSLMLRLYLIFSKSVGSQLLELILVSVA